MFSTVSLWIPFTIIAALGQVAAFAISAVGYRGAILLVPDVSFVTAASFTLACALLVQTIVLSIYLAWQMPGVLTKIIRMWRPSMFAGFIGSASSEFWFLAFALTAAANVRTLSLIEVLFAHAVSTFGMKQPVSWREIGGIALILVGVGVLVAS